MKFFYRTNEYFERKHSLRTVDVVFGRALRCYCFDCIYFTDGNHMTVIHWDYGTKHLRQMHFRHHLWHFTHEQKKSNKSINSKSLFLIKYANKEICCLNAQTPTHTPNIYIYIYIYIYIRVLVVTKSFCGFVSNQVQYNMKSAQYLG